MAQIHSHPIKAALFAVALVVPVSLFAQDAAGPYLAGRAAFNENDFSAAAQYFTQALMSDPKDIGLMDKTVLSFIGAGEFDKAFTVARRLHALDAADQMANMALLASAVHEEDYEGAEKLLMAGDAVGPLVDGLSRAWLQVGQGRMSEALKSFDATASQKGLENFGLYHKALALALAGDMEAADKIFSGEAGAHIPATRRGVIAHVQILSQLERNEDALKLVGETFGPKLDPEIEAIVAKLKAGETLPFSTVRNARDGVSEVFFSVASALNGDSADSYTLIYARLASYLRPKDAESILLTAQLLEKLGRYELATRTYGQISRDDPAFLSAELGRAEALRRADKSDAAIEVLEQLAKSFPGRSSVWMDLGDAYRMLERFDEAAAAYDKAIDLLGEPAGEQWALFYRAGIAQERAGNWPEAEKDFRKALDLNPDQPQVLNYLGYSYVEQKAHLDEALDMIRKAVAEQPNDGYITDSLGWVLFRLGRYDEAVVKMEKAVELVPFDAIITDHLGDVYWAVGRKREAEFQWSRALSFGPEEKDAKRIKRKLAVGLDQVLHEEGAPPLAMADGN